MTQAATTSEYIYQTDLPALEELTICFWLRAVTEEDLSDSYIISLAATGTLFTE